MKKLYWVLFFLITLLCSSVSADDTVDSVFDAALKKYMSGDYEGAISGFNSMIDYGLSSGNILYNLGNAYLKTNKLGYAILSYERARLYIPRDSDLLSNYQYARSLIKQKEAIPKKSFIFIGLEALFSYLTLNETYHLFMTFYYFIVLLIILCIFLSQLRRYLIPTIAMLSIIWITITVPMVGKFADASLMGVIVSDIVDVKFEPSKTAAVNFPLYAGMRVHILSTKGDWRKIGRLDGKIGWVERSSVEPIAEEAQKI